MTIRELQIFSAVVETGSMQAASKKLFIAQSAVSQTVAGIEKKYNTILFERYSHKLFITESGRELYRYAQQILTLFADMDQKMTNTRDTVRFRIGCTITIGAYLMTPLIEQFRKDYPSAQIEVFVHSPASLQNMLMNNMLDLALMESDPPRFKDEVVIPFLDDEMVLVCSPKHRFAKMKSVTLEQISKESYIAREENESIEMFRRIMQEKNLPLFCSWHCNNSETIKNAVISNCGITVISKRIVSKELEEKTLVEVPIENVRLMRKFNLMYHKDKYRSAPLNRLIDLIENLKEE